MLLHNTGPPSKLIRQQFDEVHENVLLFLQKIQEIRIRTYGEDGNLQSSSCISSKPGFSKSKVNLSKQVIKGTTIESSSRIYYVVTKDASGLAKHDNRSYTEEEERAKSYSNAKVLLAFPMTEDMIPVIEPQEVFAFLPLRRTGLPVSLTLELLVRGTF